ncbi:MAG: YlmC/YmxH family sporulation protein [Bacillota bacterium]
MKKSELVLKDVIDIERGKRLGYINDVDLDIKQGKIKAVIVPHSSNFILKFFSQKENFIIDWNDIVKIGEDVILVRV